MSRMLITLMFSAVAKKSRTFSSFPRSADEQACRSWDSTRPDSQSKLASRNIPRHGRHAQFMNGGWPKGRYSAFQDSFFSPSFFSWEFELFCLFWGISQNLQNLQVPGSKIADWGLAKYQSLGGEKMVLYIVCFAYSLLVFPVLPY